ncbi:DUF4192 family protein [Streptomyces sp. NPDC049954]|uniref:DUF4192 family protein n=1 Tax=Streptomyces sp. NPDC049954 TaxID=3155779 RepID=UPI0034304959
MLRGPAAPNCRCLHQRCGTDGPPRPHPGPRTRDIVQEFRAAAPADTDFLKTLDTAVDQFNTRRTTSAGRDAILTSTCAQIDAAGTADIIGGALADFRNGSSQLTDEIAARITLGLQDRETRDAVLSTGDESDLPVERQLWAYLVRCCVPPHTDKAAPLLVLLGWVAWRQNDTVTASHAFSDALDIDPHYTLAKHLLEGIRTDCAPAGLLAIFREADQRFAAGRADLDNL